MRSIVKCDSYKTDYADVPYLESSVIHNEKDREIILFVVNRSLDEDMDISIRFENFEECISIEHIQLYSDDLNATNSAEHESVSPTKINVSAKSNLQSVVLKNHSWNMIKYKY